MTQVERAAHALDWAAQASPKQFVAYNVLLKAITGQATMPRLKSDDVELLRSRMSRVRKILREKYGRGLTMNPGVGTRATIDSVDQLTTDVSAAAKRAASAGRGLVAAASLVDITEVPATAENRPWLQWWKGSLRQQVAMISSPEYLRKLLPPKDDEEHGTDAEATPAKAAGGGAS